MFDASGLCRWRWHLVPFRVLNSASIYFLGNYIYSAIKAARESLPFLHLESLVIFSQKLFIRKKPTPIGPCASHVISSAHSPPRLSYRSPAHNRRSATFSTRWLSPFFRMRSAR